MFESLWIDKEYASSTLGALKQFSERGYCIIENAVPHEIIDTYLAQFEKALEEDKFLASYGSEELPAKNIDINRPLTKILDTYVHCHAACDIAFAEPIKSFLEVLFEGPALAFQGLHFNVGSTQAVHQDTAYVVVEHEPKSLAAAWIALEDIQPGTGELVYYPGSHRFGDFLYPDNRRHWSPADDGGEIHAHHLHWLHEEAKRRGIEAETFLPKKGSVLIWHADLAHGGGTITRPEATRKSLVFHYCPSRCSPHYFDCIAEERREKKPVGNGGFTATMYY